MTEQFANNASSTLNGAINNSTTSIVVTNATSFPTSPEFRLLLGVNPLTAEIVLVTAVAGNTFTVLRGQEGTTASSWPDLTTVTHILTAGAVDALRGDGYFHVNILSGLNSNIGIGSNTFLRVGSCIINNIDYGIAPFAIFESIFEATTGQTAEIRLYNVTDGMAVSNSTLTTTSNSSDYKSAAISLAAGTKIYEAQIRITNGSPNETDGVICSSARIRIK